MLTTRMIPVLYNMTGFIKKFQYPNISQTLSVEIGGTNNVRFFASEQGSVTPNASLLGNDIANCFVALKKLTKLCGKQGVKLALSICLLDITTTHVCLVILLVARSIKDSALQMTYGSKIYALQVF